MPRSLPTNLKSAPWGLHAGRWMRFISAAVIALLAITAYAQAAAPCGFETIGSGNVRAVSDGRTFALADGREVRLADIEVPALAQGDAGGTAKAALEALVAGQTITLKQLKPQRDRYGRWLAHAFVIRDGGERSVARDMVAQGHARVAARVIDPACVADLLASERAARAAKLGLWANSYYSIRQADRPAEVLADKGRFALVEGKVLSVRESGGTIYVNFGRRWTRGLHRHGAQAQ